MNPTDSKVITQTDEDTVTATCELCGSKITMPVLDDLQRASLEALEMHLYHRIQHHGGRQA